MSAPSLSPQLLARHPGTAGLTSDQREKFVCRVHCSTGHSFPGSPGGWLRPEGAEQVDLGLHVPHGPRELCRGLSQVLGLHMKLYFESKPSVGKVCKIPFKHKNMEVRH